jgi:thiamine pyrophosphate-dependent acetolactate synthase large subunit-like protein
MQLLFLGNLVQCAKRKALSKAERKKYSPHVTPGALNFSTGAAYALLGAMPMILITGQKGILSSKQGRFQIVDVVSSMTPLTKMAHQIVSTATIPTIVREAFMWHVRNDRELSTWNYPKV